MSSTPSSCCSPISSPVNITGGGSNGGKTLPLFSPVEPLELPPSWGEHGFPLSAEVDLFLGLMLLLHRRSSRGTKETVVDNPTVSSEAPTVQRCMCSTALGRQQGSPSLLWESLHSPAHDAEYETSLHLSPLSAHGPTVRLVFLKCFVSADKANVYFLIFDKQT